MIHSTQQIIYLLQSNLIFQELIVNDTCFFQNFFTTQVIDSLYFSHLFSVFVFYSFSVLIQCRN
jgi:hypothetical protein